jgi:alpha-ketoglutarate-dependent taurine dioxygenase
LEYGVLVFPAQYLTGEEQLAFGLRFGEREGGLKPPPADKPLPTRPGLIDGVAELSNVSPSGEVLSDPKDPQVEYLAGNDVWHTDSSFLPVSAKCSILSCIESPSQGGETAWADMRTALQELDPAERDRLAGLRAWHSLAWSQAIRGVFGKEPAEDPTTMKGAWHAVVRRHPETGREALYIGRHACAIEGMDLGEAQALLGRLVEDACQPPRVFAHSWAPGDVVIWDNRCVLHQVRPWDLHERRIMWHVRIGGEASEAL